MVKKYWEANIKGDIITAPTLKELAVKLKIKPSLIEGVYYRSRLEDKIKIRKVVEEIIVPKLPSILPNAQGLFELTFP
jgi:hypothetical protein